MAKELHLLRAVNFCQSIVRLSDELLDNYDVSISEPGDQHTRTRDKIDFTRKVHELQRENKFDGISNDSLTEVVKFATTASSQALAHIMQVANSLKDDEHRSTSNVHLIIKLRNRGMPQAPDDTTGTPDDRSVGSSVAIV